MALTRGQARPREHHELRRYLRDYIESPRLREEAMDLWADIPHASVDNILWATLRHQAGDPGTLRAKIEVRAKRNTELHHLELHKIRHALDEAIPAGLDHTAEVERLLTLIQEVVSGPVD